MMRLVCLLFVALIFGSCSRCKTCTLNSPLLPLEAEVCREDFDSGKDYRDAIKDLEDNMWECK